MFSKIRCLLVRRSQVVVFLACLQTLSIVATASCPPGSQYNPKWRWNYLYYTYYGAASVAAIDSATQDWNASLSSPAPISQAGPYNDFQFRDSVLQAGRLGQTTAHSEAEVAVCNNKRDVIYPYCYDLGMMSYGVIEFDLGQIQDVQTNWNLTQAQVVRKVAAHEIGHAFDLGDDGSYPNCDNPSIMDSAQPYYCHFDGPQACDFEWTATYYSGYTRYPYAGGCDPNWPC